MDIPIKRVGESKSETTVPRTTEEWMPSQSAEAWGKLRRIDTKEIGEEPSEQPPQYPEKPSSVDSEQVEGSTKLFDWILRGAIFLSLFLVPLFYFFSSDTFGFSKSILVGFLAMIALAAWVAKTISAGKAEWRGGPVVWGALSVLVVAALSAVFSSATWVSVFGDVGRYGFSVFAIASYVILFIVTLANFKRRDVTYGVLSLVAGAGVLAVLSLFQFMELFILPGQFTKAEAFSPVGSLFVLSLFAALMFPILISLYGLVQRRWVKIVVVVIGILNLLILLSVNFKTAWMLLAISLLVYLVLVIWRHGPSTTGGMQGRKLLIPILVLVLSLIMWLLPNAPSIGLVAVPVEVIPSYGASFDVLKGAWGDNFILGTGPETFPYEYGKYKDESINQTNFWGINFVDANAELISWAVMTGLLGLLVLAAFVALVLARIFSRAGKASSPLFTGLFAAWAFVLVSKFFYPTAIPLEILFWVLPALMVVELSAVPLRVQALKAGSSRTVLLFVGSIVLLVVAAGGIYVTLQRWVAEARYTNASTGEVTEENIEERVESAGGAIRLHPRDARYFRTLSELLVSQAQLILGDINARPAAERRPTADEAQQIRALTSSSLDAITQALEMDPENVTLHIAAGNIYAAMSGYVEGALDQAISVYEEAIELEPVNPFLHTQLAQLYLVKARFFADPNVRGGGEISRAKAELEEAIRLNENYSNARYFLGLILDREGNRQAAIEQFERIAQFNPGNETVTLILNNLRAGRPALSPPVPANADEPPVENEEAQGIPEETTPTETQL